MVAAGQLTQGMTIAIGKSTYRVEQITRVAAAPKVAPFIKVKLRDLGTDELVEKNFKQAQEVEEVKLEEHKLEFLYQEEGSCVFLDTATLELLRVSGMIVGSKLSYLKEGTEVKAVCFKNSAFSLDLPQFLELMVSAIEANDQSGRFGKGARVATLETGAKVEVPPFVDVGDVIKIDPKKEEYIQRV